MLRSDYLLVSTQGIGKVGKKEALVGIFVVIREIFISYLDTYNYIDIILYKFLCAIGTYMWLYRVFREKRRHFKESVKIP